MCQVLEQCSIRAITKLNLRGDRTILLNNKGRFPYYNKKYALIKKVYQ